MENNQNDEFELPKDIEKYAYPLEIWILKLDKYIDVSYRPQVRKLGFRIGIISSVFFFIMLQMIHLLSKDIFVEMMIPFVLSMGALIIQSGLWFEPRRIEQEYAKKQPYDCGCNRDGIPKFNERGWISSRFWRQYSCNLYEMWHSFAWGWLLIALPLSLANWALPKILF